MDLLLGKARSPTSPSASIYTHEHKCNKFHTAYAHNWWKCGYVVCSRGSLEALSAQSAVFSGKALQRDLVSSYHIIV